MFRCKDCEAWLTREEMTKEKLCPYCGGSKFVELDSDVERLEER